MERGRGAGFVLLLAGALLAGAPAHGHPAAGGAAALHAAESGGHAEHFDCARCAGGSAQRPLPAQIALPAPECTARLDRARPHGVPLRAALARAAAPRAPPARG